MSDNKRILEIKKQLPLLSYFLLMAVHHRYNDNQNGVNACIDEAIKIRQRLKVDLKFYYSPLEDVQLAYKVHLCTGNEISFRDILYPLGVIPSYEKFIDIHFSDKEIDYIDNELFNNIFKNIENNPAKT